MTRLRFLTILHLVLISACSINDAVWVQRATVPLLTKDFHSCAINAISTVPNVAVDVQYLANNFDIPLTTPLNSSIENLTVFLRLTSSKSADILFIGKGTTESAEQIKLITPLLAQLKNALRMKCGY
jgi:hypothetical protein